MIELYDRHGNKLGSGRVLGDGEVLRVPQMLMDGAPPDIAAITRAAVADSQPPQAAKHRPGSAVLTDADRATRENALDARDKRLVDAWKNLPAVNAAQIEKPAPTGNAADRRDGRLRDAWKGVN